MPVWIVKGKGKKKKSSFPPKEKLPPLFLQTCAPIKELQGSTLFLFKYTIKDRNSGNLSCHLSNTYSNFSNSIGSRGLALKKVN